MNEVNEASPANAESDLERLVRRQCICCANGNDLPDGEWCRACIRVAWDRNMIEGKAMNEEQQEEILSALEGAANFLRGACFDRRIPPDTRDAMAEKAAEIDRVTEKYT